VARQPLGRLVTPEEIASADEALVNLIGKTRATT
jgi:hypothetical protein